MAPQNTKSFMESINQSDKHLFRSLTFFLVLVIALAFLFKSVVDTADISAEFNKDGRLIINAKRSSLLSYSDGSKSYATFLLPSNAVWFDTGLELDSEQECIFKITGRVHLAVQRIVESAANDSKCPIPWTGADGSEWKNIGDTDSQLNAKEQLLIKPNDNIGKVIGYYIPENEANQFQDYFAKNRAKLTANVFAVGTSKVVQNDTGKKIKIYLSINDVLLDFTPSYLVKSELAYCGDKKSELRNSKWLELKNSEYSNLYFDDNIGSFLVQVEIRSKKK